MIEELRRKGLQIQRYKGLGGMNAEQLWETTMDPAKRNLLEVKVEEMEAAKGIFIKMMGDLVGPRSELIEDAGRRSNRRRSRLRRHRRCHGASMMSDLVEPRREFIEDTGRRSNQIS